MRGNIFNIIFVLFLPNIIGKVNIKISCRGFPMGVMGRAEIFDKSFAILRKHIKTIVLYILAFSVIVFVGMIVFIFLGAIIGVNLSIAFLSAGFMTNVFLISIVTLYILFIIGFGLCFQVGIIKIASQEFLNESIYADQAIKSSIKSIFKVIRVIIAAMLLFLPIIAVLAIVIYILSPKIEQIVLLGFQGQIPLIIFLMIFLFVAMMLVLGYITILSFALHVAIIEKKGGFSSIKKSYQLVKKNFWKVFGCIILFMLSIYAIYISLQSFLALILGLVYLIMKILNMQLDYMTFMAQIYSFTRWPFFMVNWLVISPLLTIMMTNLYFNQRFKKEGFDLVLRLEKLVDKKERKQLSDSLQT